MTLTSPLLFNDPFDSIYYDHYISKDFRWLNIAKQQGWMNDIQIRNVKYRSRLLDDKTSHVFNSFGQRILRVDSFTTKYRNSLMWSHYSDSDKGICINYDCSNYKDKSFIFPTLYSNEVLNMSDLGNPQKLDNKTSILALISCGIVKQDIWKYENEWRFMLPLGALGLPPRISVKSPNISRIFLGPNFIGYWVQVKNNEAPNGLDKRLYLYKYFYPFCDFIKKNNIPIYSMITHLGQYDLNVSSQINIDALKSLEAPILHKYYRITLLGYY